MPMERTTQSSDRLSRRRFVQAAAGISLSAVGLALVTTCCSQGLSSFPFRGGSALETTTLRVSQQTGICQSAQYGAEDMLRAEGFTDLHYIPLQGSLITDLLASGEI